MTFSNRKAIRLKEYDYNCNGAYFITICTYGRQCIFGNVVDGAMYLSELGKIAYDEMIVTNNKRTIDGISVDKFVCNAKSYTCYYYCECSC